MQQVNYSMNTSVNDNQNPHAMYQQNAQIPSYEQIQYQYLMVPNQSIKTSPNPMANISELPQATTPPLAMPMQCVNGQPMYIPYNLPSSPAMPQYYMPQFAPTTAVSPTMFNFPSQPSLNSQLSTSTATSSMGSLPSISSLENQTSTSSNVSVNLMTPVFLPNMMMDLQSMPQQGVHHPAQLGGLLVPQHGLTPMMNVNGMTPQSFTPRYVSPSPMMQSASSTQYLAPSDGGCSQSISRGASTQPSPAYGPQEDPASENQTDGNNLEISGNGMMQMTPFTQFVPNVMQQQQQLLGYYKCDPARVPVAQQENNNNASRSRSSSAKNQQLRSPPGFYGGSASRSPQHHGQTGPTDNTQTPMQQNSARNNGRQQRRGKTTKNARMAPSMNDRAPKPTGRKKKQGKSKKKYGFRSKQNKIKAVMDNLTAKFTALGSFVESDRVLRGENVVRVHVKKYQPLCEIEDALDACLVAQGVDIVEISLPLSMKNEFQRKGFLCYIKVQSKEQIPAIQRVLRQWQSFQKCDVALPSDKNKNLPRQTERTNVKTEVICTSTVGEIPHLTPSTPEVCNNFTEHEESKFNTAGPNPYELLSVSSTEDDLEEEEDDFDTKIFAFAPPNMAKSSSVVSIGDAA